MDPDLLFVAGLVLVLFAIPSMIGAYADRRFPRWALIVAVVGAACLAWAFNLSTQGYTLVEVPEVFIRVFARYIA